MKDKNKLNRRLLVYIGFAGFLFIFLYSVIIAQYFMFGLELHSKVIFENEAKNYNLEVQDNPDIPLPESSTLRSYRSQLDIPQVLLALYSQSNWQRGSLDMSHGKMKIFERSDFDKYKDAFDVDSLCFNERCETVSFYSYQLHDGGWLYMVMGLPDTEKDKLHNTEFDNAAKTLILIAILFFCTIIGLALLLSKKIVDPITQLAKWSETLSLSKLDQPHPDLKFEELDILATQLKGAFIRLNQALDNEKDFLSSASHELRTPIAVLSTNLSLMEALLEDYSSGAAEKKVLARLVRAVENMRQLTQTLLWLSKDLQDFPESTQVDLSLLLPQIIEENEYLTRGKNIELECNAPACSVEAPEILCKIVLTNLLRNAFQYTREGIVSISCERNSVEITNVSATMSSLDPDSTEQSFGIGLELVRRISQKLRWHFSSKDIERGRTVVIDFNSNKS